jgi:hypothetical protein
MFRRRPQPPSDVRNVSLDQGAGTDTTLTQIGNADLLSPVAHSLPRLDPHQSDLRVVVTAIVEALATGGALDEFTVDVLDGWIDHERATWDAQVHQTAQQRRHVAATILNQHVQNATTARGSLAILRANRDRFAAEYDAACIEAGLAPVAQPQKATRVTDASTAEPFAFGRTLLAQELLAPPDQPPATQPPLAAAETEREFESEEAPAARSAAGIDNIADFPVHAPVQQPIHQSNATQNGDPR